MRLTLISQEPSIEEFQALQATAVNIRKELGIEIEKDQVLRIYNLGDTEDLAGDDKLIWERSILEDDNVPVDNDNGHDESSHILKRRFCAHWAYSMRQALHQGYQDEMMQSYCDMASLIHFAFCHFVPIRHCNSGADSGGKLSQLFGPPLRLSNTNDLSERRVWQMYQKLSLKLRLGSDSVEATLGSYDKMTAKVMTGQDTISQHRPSQLLHEERLTDDDFVSLTDGDEVYVALRGVAVRGPNYELYAVLPASLSSPSDVHMLCSTLIETLLSKGDKLEPLSFL